jgi:ABC-type multidrug transport system ATPase subunit
MAQQTLQNGGVRLEVSELEISFNGQVLFRDFNLKAEPGEKVVLTGPSGCGKSSILACVLGFQAPSAGAIRINGEPLTGPAAWELRKRMAYVPQEPDPGRDTARAWLEAPFEFHANRELKQNLKKLPTLCEQVGLSPALLDQPGTELSGGEKQRLTLVGALLLDRPLLLLDEPTSALDPASRDRVHTLLRELEGPTVLMVSHDQSPSLDFADQVLHVGPASEEIRHGRA